MSVENRASVLRTRHHDTVEQSEMNNYVVLECTIRVNPEVRADNSEATHLPEIVTPYAWKIQHSVEPGT